MPQRVNTGFYFLVDDLILDVLTNKYTKHIYLQANYISIWNKYRVKKNTIIELR